MGARSAVDQLKTEELEVVRGEVATMRAEAAEEIKRLRGEVLASGETIDERAAEAEATIAGTGSPRSSGRCSSARRS